MSVFLRTNRWAASRVPYVIANDASGDAEKWFGELNACIGFGLLVPKQPVDVNYVELTIGADSRSEAIGCRHGGKQTIGGTKKFTVIHELLHALGFKHEQLHQGFPWDDTDPTRQKVNRLFSYEGKMQSLQNKNLYAEILNQAKSTVFYADNNLTSRLEAMLDANTEHWGKCDLDSVMMYPVFKRALLACQMTSAPQAPDVVASGISPHCDVLSNQDVAALRYMYPPPPPPPPRSFEVTFQGYPRDFLELTFSVRSTHNPGRVANFRANPLGRATVRGFDPDHAEISVQPWPYWSRVRSDMSVMLPGGRYLYSVRLL
jgi:hypothetical protein